MRRIKAAGIGLDGVQREHFEVPSLRSVVEEIRRQVEDGRGFVLLRRLPIEDYSKDDLGLIFWGIGTHLGRGLSQSVMGDRLGHVKDFSRRGPWGARLPRQAGIVTAYGFVRLGWSVVPAQRAGGQQAAYLGADQRHSVHNAALPGGARRRARGALPRLCPPPARRREAGRSALHAATHRIPVYSNVEGKVSARYVRSYIEAGEAAAGRPMGPAERAIIDTFEAVTKRPELMLEFTLQPGEAYFINNYTILHARTAFDDGDAPEVLPSPVQAVARRANQTRASLHP